MRLPDDAPFEEILARRLDRARRVALVGVGDELLPADRLGVLAARAVGRLRLPNLGVFEAGPVPEAFTAPIRRYEPDHVLLVDAADMGSPPGTLAVIGASEIQATRLSTHALPLSVVMAYLEQTTGAPATLVGIQPALPPERDDLAPQEAAAIARLTTALQRLLLQ
ncbi:MAG TPA: hydrogenase maturation protease [Thermoplasmata archaeon]|nr:hydrogenase maturation protease [Thermoplasmata archaeon]